MNSSKNSDVFKNLHDSSSIAYYNKLEEEKQFDAGGVVDNNVDTVERQEIKLFKERPKSLTFSVRPPTRALLAPPNDEKVQQLWNAFSALSNDQWWQEFTPFHIHFPFHVLLVGVVSAPYLIKFDLLTVFYLYISKLGGSSVNEISVPKFNIISSSFENKAGLSGLLNILTLFKEADSASQTDTQFAVLKREIVTYYIPDKELALTPVQTASLVEDVVTYVKSCAQAKIQHTSDTEVCYRFYTVFNTLNDQGKQLLQKTIQVLSNRSRTYYYPVVPTNKKAKHNSLLDDIQFLAHYHFFSTRERFELRYANLLYTARNTDYLTRAAVAIVMLQQVAKIMLKTPEELESALTEYLDTIKHILVSGNQFPPLTKPSRNLAGLYFLHLIPNKNLFHALVPKKLKLIGLDDWNIKDGEYDYFPFMLETKSELGQWYLKIFQHLQETEANFFGWIQSELRIPRPQKERLEGIFRMMIFLICYYQYYNRVRPCKIILNLLKNSEFTKLVDIKKELVVFEMIAREPPRTTNNDPLDYIFSKQMREEHEDFSFANIMVNCMAVALGSPRNSNHIYTYAFDFSSSGALSPGSQKDGKIKTDEGYPFDFDSSGTLSPGSQKSGKVNEYGAIHKLGSTPMTSLALNVLVWSSLAWSCLIESPKATLNFLSGFRKKLGFFEKLSLESKVRVHITERAQQYLTALCNHPTFVANHIHGGHFITESLHAMWKAINPDEPRNSLVWTGIFQEEARVVAYERALDDIFESVIFEYPALKLQNCLAHTDNQHLRNIVELQEHHAAHFPSPLLPFSEFIQFVQSKNEDPNTATEEKKYVSFVATFAAQLDKLHTLKHIKTLVNFYTHLHNTYTKRADKMGIGFPDCVLEKSDEDQEKIEWNRFRNAWAEIFTHFEVDQKIPERMLLQELVYYSRTRQGIVYKLLQQLVNYQTLFLQLGTEKMHPMYLPTELNLEEVSAYYFDDLIILGGYSKMTFEHLVMSQAQLDKKLTRASLNFDLKRIADLIWDKTLNGKVELYIPGFFEQFQSTSAT